MLFLRFLFIIVWRLTIILLTIYFVSFLLSINFFGPRIFTIRFHRLLLYAIAAEDCLDLVKKANTLYLFAQNIRLSLPVFVLLFFLILFFERFL